MKPVLASEMDKLKQMPISNTDACKHCGVRGNYAKCIVTDCIVHDSWFVDQLLQVARLWQDAAGDLANQLEDRDGKAQSEVHRKHGRTG